MTPVTFSIDDYDHDGDINEEGIFLHFGTTRILVAKTITEFEQLIENMQCIVNEVKAYHPEVPLE